MDYIEECLEKFNNLPQELQDYLNSEKSIKTLEEIEKEFGVDLTLALVLVFIDELDLEDLSIYIQEKYNLDNLVTNKILFKLEDGILKEVAERISDFEEVVPEKDYILDLDISEKKRLIFSIFSEKIIEQLKSSEEHLFRLNAVTFELVGKDESFLNRLVRAFLENKEKISDKFIVTKGKTLDPTISNWVKDFVSDHGSDIVTAVSLAKYLTNNENIKKIDQEERQILRQVLKIYKNLVFFPDSMDKMPYKDWEIFPINRDSLIFYSNKKEIIKKGALISKDNVVREQKKEEIISSPEKAEEEKEIEKARKTLEDKSLEELNDLLKNNPDKNLKRKAIESEIKKIKKNN